jgi:hypothetical protein
MKKYLLSSDEIALILKALRCYEDDMNRPRSRFLNDEIADLMQFITDAHEGATA